MRSLKALTVAAAVALCATAASAAEPLTYGQPQHAQEHRIAELRAIDQRLSNAHTRREQAEARLLALRAEHQRLEAEVAQLARDEAALIQAKHALEGRY